MIYDLYFTIIIKNLFTVIYQFQNIFILNNYTINITIIFLVERNKCIRYMINISN